MTLPILSDNLSNIIALAWADEVSFDMIKRETGLSEPEVKALMRANLKAGSYRVWRKRVSGRKLKHDSRTQQAHRGPWHDDHDAADG